MKIGKKIDRSLFIMLLPAIFVLLCLFIYPFIFGLYLSFTTKDGTYTLANYIRFFSDQWEYRTIWITLYISLPVTLICVGLSIPLAYYMRRGIKSERMITFFLIIPLTLGTVLVSQGMLTFLGPKGWVNQFLMFIGIVKDPIQFTHNMLGVILSVVIQNFPYSFLMLLGYISGISPDLEKASQMLGASKSQTFWKIMFPIMAPGVAITFCLNFVMAFSVYPSAVLLGQPSGPTRVIAYAAYQWAFEKYDQNMGSTISVIMGVIELIVIALVLSWRSHLQKGASIVGKG